MKSECDKTLPSPPTGNVICDRYLIFFIKDYLCAIDIRYQ